MASAQRLCVYGAPSGRKSRWHVQNVVSELHNGQRPLVWWPICRARSGERLRYTDKFDDPNLPGEMQVTVTLKKVLVGTELDIVQAGLPDAIPVEACYLGWQQSLQNLAKLVEPEINQ